MATSGGFLTEHMALHIVAMNVAAPLAIFLWRRFSEHIAEEYRPGSLAASAALQLLLLWGWHVPSAFAFAMASPVAGAAMHVSLFGAALWFWHSVFAAAGEARWRALGALLVTGKLFCLLGVLLAFAPRPLFAGIGHAHEALAAKLLLEDQQLAGLMMLIACPLAYVGAAVIIAARWISEMERQPPGFGVERFS